MPPPHRSITPAQARLFPIPPRSAGSCTLYCLPSAGSSASMYAEWDTLAPTWLEVCPVEYPGHGARLDQALSHDPASIAEEIAHGIATRGAHDFAIFGHSVGVALAWRVAGLLEQSQAAGRLRLIAISGRPENADAGDRRGRHSLPTPAFLQEVKKYSGLPAELYENQELLDFFLPILRNDFHLNEALLDDAPTHTERPLLAFSGSDDPDTNSPPGMEAWAVRSREWLGHHAYPGGHFYLRDKSVATDMLALLAQHLALRLPRVSNERQTQAGS